MDAGGDVLISFSGNLGEQWVGSSQCVGQSEELGTMFATPKGFLNVASCCEGRILR